ncbi:hypothetical protein DP030_23005 [Escherichia coli O106]|nr:hypothetical protein [Escherichia coli O106]
MTTLKTCIRTITYLSDIGCLEIQGASLLMILSNFVFGPLPWSRKLCLRMQNLRKEFAFLESF